MLIQLFLAILNFSDGTCTSKPMLEQFYLKHLRFKVALQTHIVTQLQGITVYQCYEECYYRKRCKSFSYRRASTMCRLNSVDSGGGSGDLELIETLGFAYSEKTLWNMSLLPENCNQCLEHEKCWSESSNKVCLKQECSIPETGPFERLLGNLFNVGNRYKVVNDNSGDEKIYTCSELPDIGTVLGGECIYSCVMEHSECQAGKCACSSGYDIGGLCIPEIGSAIGGGCIYSCAVEHSDCQLGICSCSSGYVEVAGNCITEPGIVLGGECVYSCAVEHSGCQGGKCLCLSGYVDVGGYCLTGIETCVRDVAYKKTVTMSSDFYDPPANPTWPNAVSGLNNGQWFGWSCSSTKKQENSYPWLLLDLEGSYIISGMKIVNRVDCCSNSEEPDETPHYVASHLGLRCLTMSHLWDARLKAERLKNLHIEVGLSVEQRYEIHNHPGVVPAVLDIALSATHTARYVKIWQQAYGYLTICGLQVFGCSMLLSPFKDCNDVRDNNFATSGVYRVNPLGSSEDFSVYCDLTTDGGGWLVFQRRKDGSVNFYRNWNDYETGFGDVSGEYWLGNRHINAIASQGDYELRVDLEDFEGNTRYAKYSVFQLGDSTVNYQLTVAGYSGTAGDSLGYHNGKPFSTYDRDLTTEKCASKYTGAWWYLLCLQSNLNGQYFNGPTISGNCAKGVDWLHWKGHCYSLKRTEMKIRRV